MTSDYVLAESLQGLGIPFLVLDEDGEPDDLTAYTTVRFVISAVDFASNTLNLTQADSEITVSALGILTFTPTAANPIPAFGNYIIQIFREGTNINKPSRRWSLEVTQEAQKT